MQKTPKSFSSDTFGIRR